MSLEARSGIVTGANRGLGLAIAKRLAEAGASLLLGARDLPKLREVQERLQALAKAPKQQILIEALDLAKESSIEAFAARAARDLENPSFLVNNAGQHGAIAPLEKADWSAWKAGITVNLLGTARLTQLAIPLLKRGHLSQIIMISGGGASSPRPSFSSYAASKSALVRLAETLAEELQGSGIEVNAIAPGAMNTRLLEEQLAAGPEILGVKAYQQALRQKTEGGADPGQAAELCLALIQGKLRGINGKLLSALWDPWKELAKHRSALEGSDIYTLRRILPKERDQNF